MSGFSLEKIYQVWNNDGGDRIEIRPDPDGLNIVEIRTVDSDGTEHVPIVISRGEQLEKVIQALELIKYDLDNPE